MSPLRVIAWSLLLSSCTSNSVAGVIAKHRPGVDRTIADIRALESRLPPGSEPLAKVEAPPVPLFLEKPKSDEDNAMFVYAEDLARPGRASEVPLRTKDSTPLLQCGSLLDSGALFFATEHTRLTPSVAQGYLSACERLRFVLVIRGREFRAPQVETGERKFVSGFYRAEVLTFDLATGKSLGGFEVSARNDEDLTVVSGEDREQRVLRNFEGAINSALREGARLAFPGSLPPPVL